MALFGAVPFSRIAVSGSAATISLAANSEGQYIVRGISGALNGTGGFGVFTGTASGSTVWASNFNSLGTLDGFNVPGQRIECGKGNAVQIILKTAGTLNAWGELDPA